MEKLTFTFVPKMTRRFCQTFTFGFSFFLDLPKSQHIMFVNVVLNLYT